ncbi:hypothetical protein L7F22_050827 [Adiantum nelumboides]|nr:hypothetical protein [Adiantum nelumboides]
MDEWRSEFEFWTTEEEERLEALKAIIEELYPGYTVVSIQEILLRFQCPLLPSFMLGLQSLIGELDEFCFEDFLNEAQCAELFVNVDMHLGIEVQLGLLKAPTACIFL